MNKSKTPVIISISQSVVREKTPQPLDPYEMMAEQCIAVADSAGIKNLNNIDTLYIVNCTSKNENFPSRRLSALLGITPKTTGYSWIGATAPQDFVNSAARRISQGETETVLITGAEAFYAEEKNTDMANIADFFSEKNQDDREPFFDDVISPVSPIEFSYGLFQPVQLFALMENALRSHKGNSIEEHTQEISRYCSNMSSIAADNPYAWSQTPRTVGEIANVDSNNRIVSFPYSKLMCSNIAVNQSSAILITSWAKAEQMGVAKDKMVFIRGFSEAKDIWHVTERPILWASPSVRNAVDHALSQASITLDEIKFLELYSCFPAAARITKEMLNIPDNDPRPLSITGGMQSFGGPGNNYTLHAICNAVEKCREEPDEFCLVQALSWYSSKHAVGIYSAQPGTQTLYSKLPKEKYASMKVLPKFEGKGLIDSYVIDFDRNGTPKSGIIIGRNAENQRFIAKNSSTGSKLNSMLQEEIIGREVTVTHSKSLNWFSMN